MRWLAVLVVACCACGGAGPTPLAKVDADEIDWRARAALRAGGEAISIVILRGDEVVLARGWGDVGGQPATARTVYPLASLSKQFWATAIAQLDEAGALDAAAPVTTVLPSFPDPRVIISQLLEHTAGIGDDADGEDDETFADLPAIAFTPGTRWSYSNRGSLIARRVAERAAGVPWPEYLVKRIAAPLRLRSVRTCAPDDAPGLPAATVERVQFVCADALDVARFEHSFDTGALLRAETVARMRRPVAIPVLGGTLPLDYGWFTRIGTLDGHRGYGHTGNFPGVSVAAFAFPDDGLTVAVLMTGNPRAGATATALLTGIVRLMLGLDTPQPRGAPPTALLEAAAGDYEGSGVRLRVSAVEGELQLEIVDPPPARWTGRLTWMGDTSFAGGPDGFDPDLLGTFHIVGDRVAAVSWGHRLMLDGVAWRIAASRPPPARTSRRPRRRCTRAGARAAAATRRSRDRGGRPSSSAYRCRSR